MVGQPAPPCHAQLHLVGTSVLRWETACFARAGGIIVDAGCPHSGCEPRHTMSAVCPCAPDPQSHCAHRACRWRIWRASGRRCSSPRQTCGASPSVRRASATPPSRCARCGCRPQPSPSPGSGPHPEPWSQTPPQPSEPFPWQPLMRGHCLVAHATCFLLSRRRRATGLWHVDTGNGMAVQVVLIRTWIMVATTMDRISTCGSCAISRCRILLKQAAW